MTSAVTSHQFFWRSTGSAAPLVAGGVSAPSAPAVSTNVNRPAPRLGALERAGSRCFPRCFRGWPADRGRDVRFCQVRAPRAPRRPPLFPPLFPPRSFDRSFPTPAPWFFPWFPRKLRGIPWSRTVRLAPVGPGRTGTGRPPIGVFIGVMCAGVPSLGRHGAPVAHRHPAGARRPGGPMRGVRACTSAMRPGAFLSPPSGLGRVRQRPRAGGDRQLGVSRPVGERVQQLEHVGGPAALGGPEHVGAQHGHAADVRPRRPRED